MKIIYSPDASGNLWTGITRGVCLEGYSVKNTRGLVELLEFRCGIHRNADDQLDRWIAYRKAMKDCKDLRIFAESFENDDIAVAKSCLLVRDAAMMLGWDGKTPVGSPRLDTLSLIEPYFDALKYPSLAERISTLIGKKVNLAENGTDATIVLAVDQDALPKIIKELLDSLRGSNLTDLESEFSEKLGKRNNDVSLFADSIMRGEAFNPVAADGTLMVRRFGNQVEMLDALVYGAEKFDVWINRDSAMLDSWCTNAGCPHPGAQAFNVLPQPLQLFFLAMNLFLVPDNAENIYAYLSAWGCPASLDGKKSFELAKSFGRNGGFFGIENLDGSKFLPNKKNFQMPDGKIRKESLKSFISNFQQHISSLIHLDISLEQQQILSSLSSMFNALDGLLDDVEYTGIEPSELDRWVHAISPSMDKTISKPEVDSFFTIPSPDCMLSPAKSVVWLDSAFNTSKDNLSQVLSLPEINSLAGYKYHESFDALVERESRYHLQTLAIPARLATDKLVLCLYVDEDKMENEANPLLVRLLSYKDFKKINQKNPHVDTIVPMSSTSSSFVQENVMAQDSSGIVNVNIPHDFILNWRIQESPSSLELLAQDPVDYVLKYFLNFKDDNDLQLPSIYLMKGNVAHMTIQDILYTKKAGSLSDIDNYFDDSFHQAVRAKGVSLYLPQNNLLLNSLRLALLSATKKLWSIIDSNGYEVEGIEFPIDDKENILSDRSRKDGDVSVKGFIDMLLCKKEDRNHKFILDFKFTGSFERYIKLLEDGRAIQLAIYKAALEEEDSNIIVDGTAYYLISESNAVIYTPDNAISGDGVIQRGHLDYDAIKRQIKKTYWERRDCISKGQIELGSESKENGMVVSVLDYHKKKVSGEDLLPLKTIQTKGVERKIVSKNFAGLKK